MYELGQGNPGDGHSVPWKLVVTYDDSRAKEIYEDFRNFTKDVWLYPAKDLLFYSADIHGNLMARQRIGVLRHLMEDAGGNRGDHAGRPYGPSAPAQIPLRGRRFTVEAGQSWI